MAKPYFRERDQTWVQQFELPPKPDGTRRRKYVTAKSKAELARKVRDVRSEIDRVGDILTNAPTVEKWLDYWLSDIAAASVRPKTLENYRYAADLIKPSIGKVRIDRLSGAHIRRMHAYIMNDEDEGCLGLSSTTARNAHAVLRKAINDAKAEGVMRGDNPAEVVRAPETAHHEAQVLDADQALTLLRSVAKDERAAIRWSLALMMAMRQGECLGLRADHVDLEAGEIVVEWQLQELKTRPRKGAKFRDLGNGFYLTEPKTSHGARVLPMPPQLAEMMRRFVPTLAPGDFVCGPGPVTQSADEKRWKRALAKAGLPAVRLHAARHSALTLLARLGVSDRVRQRIAGHASAQITNAIYTHDADAADLRDAAAKMGAALAIEP